MRYRPSLLKGQINWIKSLPVRIAICSLLLVTIHSQRLYAGSLLPLHVSGNKLMDSSDKPVSLRGVNICSLEWSPTGDHVLQSVQSATTAWHATILRIPLCEDFWFGQGAGQTDGGTAYRSLVHQVTKAAEDDGAYVILDLHWSDGDQWGTDIGQHKMPGQHSLTFWQSLASAYANAPSVLFDLYNEPHDITWDIWQNGGEITDHSNNGDPDHTYQSPGMQGLLNEVRATGAKNVVVAGGPGWASDFSGLTSGHALRDSTGHGVIYADHFYPFGGETVDQWANRIATVAERYPVIISEFGTDPAGGHGETGAGWIQETLGILHYGGYTWIAWCMHTTATPSLISDWNYTPTPHFGVFVQKELLSYPTATDRAKVKD